MGYDVTLLRGNVVISAEHHDAAVQAVRELDARDELKSGWSQVSPDGRVTASEHHWAFTDAREVAAATTLVEMLRVWRFQAVTAPNGSVLGVEFLGQGRGHEEHLWRALASYVEPGGELLWVGEDDAIRRWSFDGKSMHTARGRLAFDEE